MLKNTISELIKQAQKLVIDRVKEDYPTLTGLYNVDVHMCTEYRYDDCTNKYRFFIWFERDVKDLDGSKRCSDRISEDSEMLWVSTGNTFIAALRNFINLH